MSIQVSTPSSPETADRSRVDRSAYLTSLVNLRQPLQAAGTAADATAWLNDIRDRAANEVRSLSIPTSRDEEWRFTDLSPLLAHRFAAADSASQFGDVTLEAIAPYLLPEAEESRLVFVNGLYAPSLSSTGALPDAIVATHLLDPSLLATHSHSLTAYLDKQEGLEQIFTTLNTASFADGAVVWIPKNQVVDAPIHLLFISTTADQPLLTHPRCLVIAGSNSSVTLVEDHVALGETDGVYFSNSVTEIWLDENARVNHTRLQRDRQTAYHIGKTAVSQARTSHYTCNAVSLGAAISRHNLEVFQAGEETETVLNGLTLIAGEQLADTHSLISYTKPYGRSRQLHKCIVDDRAHGVFNGKVNVPQTAQMTDAGQLNRNLLLSPRGRVDTKPQLEIVADNVKCTHGATVSQLDADEVFYLQSRGISVSQAQNLLIFAFAADVIQHIPLASLRESLSKSVEALTR